MSARQTSIATRALPVIQSPARRRPLKITALSVLCWALGPLCVILPGVLLAGREMPNDPLLLIMTLGMGTLGLFLTLSGIGLWRMELWGVVSFALFVAAIQVVRLPLTLYGIGAAGSIESAVWTGFWLLITIDLWRSIKKHPQT